MSDSDVWWEPPLAGDEVSAIVAALERLRTTFRWKADDLSAEALDVRIGASTMTIGGLLKHLAAAEDYMFTAKLRGEPIGTPWDAMGWDGSKSWSFTWDTEGLSADELYALWDGAVARSRARLAAALADGGLDQSVHLGWDGRNANLRRLVCDLIEEYGRHTGHADLLREAIDGRVGEDPPDGWKAQRGSFGPPP